MIKVKIKTNRAVAPRRQEILCITSKFSVKCSKLQEANDIFIMWCNTESDVDALFSTACMDALGTISCVPQLPPEMKARRTIFLKHVDDLVCERDTASIIEDLQQRNANLKVADLFVFTKSSTIKVTCETIAMANKARDLRVFVFEFFVPSVNIALDEYINLIMCYKCYSYNDHLSSMCPKPSDFKICSLCSRTDHTYKQCPSAAKECVNCGGPHSTLALSCPYRRKIIKEKSLASSRPTYSSITKSNVPLSGKDILPNANEVIAKSVMCMVVSAMKNAEVPGSFVSTMDHLLRANNLPQFSLGDITPPSMLSLSEAVQTVSSYPITGNAATASRVAENTQNKPASRNVEKSSDSVNPLSSLKAKLYKKKSTPQVTPDNVRELHSKGYIIVECSTHSSIECVCKLESVTSSEFNNLAEIIDLRDRIFEQQSNNSNASINRRQLRGNAGNNILSS